MATKSDYFEDTSRVLKLGLKINKKTEKDLEEDIKIVRDWVKTQSHIPETPSDHAITCFLIMNKFSIENAKQKIDMYYTMRSLFPEFFDDKHPLSPHLQETMDSIYFLPLPKATKEGYRVIVIHSPINDPDKFNIFNYFAHAYNIYEVRLHEDYPVGDVIVYDFKNLKMGHIVQFTPTIMKKTATILEKVYNNNVKQIHLVNYPPFAEPIISLSMQMLKPKLARRFHFHRQAITLTDFIPVSILPRDFGGEELSMKELNEIWKKKFVQYRERFDLLRELRVKEELRPTPLVNDEVLGFYGNFKKLSVD